MYKTFFVFTLFSFSLVLAVVSCKKDDNKKDYTADADCTAVDASTNTYNNVVSIILDLNCATSGCHDAITAAEGVDLSNYGNTKKAFESKAVLCSIHHGSECTAMPQGADKLDDTSINLIDCWVKNGYAE